jgi:hypothetical protein
VRRTFGLALLATFALVSSPREASATTGGPQTVEILGYEPVDEKVFMLRHFHDEGGALPQLEYMFVEGPHAGQVIQVRSWYRGPDSMDATKLNERLAALRARLKALPKLRALPTLAAKHLRDITIPATFPGDAPWIVGEMRVNASTPSHEGSKKIVLARGPLEIVDRRELPGAALVTIRYRGIFFETGYTTETTLLLAAKP